MRIALYARISTKNTHQDLDTQLIALRAWAERKLLNSEAKLQSSAIPLTNESLAARDIVTEYTDAGISGSIAKRPGLDRLMSDAVKRKIDVVVVARFDRFARSMRHLVNALAEFQSLAIEFVSLAEAVDSSTPMGKAMFGMIAVMAELERNIIRERVIAGLDRAKKAGKKPVGKAKAKPAKTKAMAKPKLRKAKVARKLPSKVKKPLRKKPAKRKR